MWKGSGILISSTTDIQVYFGNREHPLGGKDRDEWERLRPRWKQVHGTGLAKVVMPGQECGEVDALWTETPGQPIGVVTADCVPILLWRTDGSAVAALHAGWRGTYARIPEVFFSRVPSSLSRPNAWNAVLGPSIRACCYEVSSDLIQQFAGAFPALPMSLLEPSPRKLDLIAVNKSVLESLGVRSVEVHPDCTYCRQDNEKKPFSPLYFSFRRGDRDSRQISIISLPPRV
jgi:YfiH family protein